MQYVEISENIVNFIYDEKTKQICGKIIIKNIFNKNILSKLYINSQNNFISNPSILFIKPNEIKEFNILKINNNLNNKNKDLFLIVNYPTNKNNLSYSDIKIEFNKIDREKITIKQKITLEGIFSINNNFINKNNNNINDFHYNESKKSIIENSENNSFEENLSKSNISSDLFKNLQKINNKNQIDILNEKIDEKHKEIETLKKNFKLSKIKLNNLYKNQKNENNTNNNIITNSNNIINNVINLKNTNINTILKNKYSTYLTLIIIMSWFILGAFINKIKSNHKK